MTSRTKPLVVVGEPEQVRSALERARDDGRLVSVRNAAQLSPGRVQVVAEVEVPRRAVWLGRAGPVVVGGVVVAGATLLGGLVWAVVTVVAALVAWIVAHLAGLAGAAAVFVLLVLLAGNGRVHCPGCPR